MVLFASEYAPVALLKNPLVLLKSDKTPVAVLKPPLVSINRARRPVAVFWLPAVSWLRASKPLPVFHSPEVRLTSTPIPSPLLEPGMLPSVSGPTACTIGASPKQATSSVMRSGTIFIFIPGSFAGISPNCREQTFAPDFRRWKALGIDLLRPKDANQRD